MKKTSAFRIYTHGTPDVLKWERVDLRPMADTDVLVHQTAVGFNYIDTYHRDGRYPLALPTGIGNEGAGVVAEVGSAVDLVNVGDRVIYKGVVGSYAEDVVVPQESLIRIPDNIDDVHAVGLFTKGMTAEYLLNRLHQVGKGEKLLVHAAAGGVGSLLLQWGKHLGAHIIGVVSTDAKAELARQDGCDDVIISTRENIPARVKELTSGEGVDVVYDSVGKDTFDDSIASLKHKGIFVSYGSASGLIPPIDFTNMWKRGLHFLVRASINNFISTRAELEHSSREAFAMHYQGTVHARIGRQYDLRDAPRCHADAEARLHTGSVVLVPSR